MMAFLLQMLVFVLVLSQINARPSSVTITGSNFSLKCGTSRQPFTVFMVHQFGILGMEISLAGGPSILLITNGQLGFKLEPDFKGNWRCSSAEAKNIVFAFTMQSIPDSNIVEVDRKKIMAQLGKDCKNSDTGMERSTAQFLKKVMLEFDDDSGYCERVRSELNLTSRNERALDTTDGRRAKRQIMPGTNWCGGGSASEDLGNLTSIDMCCRDHDNCPHYIEAWETKYHLFNYGIYTISHCACDEEFRSCLRNVRSQFESDYASLLGLGFFHMFQTECFIFVPHRVCASRTWYGRCNRYKNTYRAELRENLDFDA